MKIRNFIFAFLFLLLASVGNAGYWGYSGGGTCDTPTGTGDVTGPASSTDSNIVTFNGTDGKTIKDSGHDLSEYFVTSKLLALDSDLIPDASGTRDLGSSEKPFAEIHTVSLNLYAADGSRRWLFANNTVDPNPGAGTYGFALYNNVLYMYLNGTAYQPQKQVSQPIATFFWNGGDSAITAGESSATGGKICMVVDAAATITGLYVKANASSTTTVIKVFSDAFSTSALATTDLTGGHDVTLTGALGMNDVTLTDWTTSIAAGNEICAYISGNTGGAKWIYFQIYGTR